MFNTGPDILKKILSFVPSQMTRDNRFIDKLVVSSVIDSLYTNHNILTSLGQNEEICLWISPPIIVNQEEIDYFFSGLDKVLEKGFVNLISSFVKKNF